jgi:hypothetical protein
MYLFIIYYLCMLSNPVLVMVYELYNMIFNLICKYFIENFDVYFLQGNWTVIFFLCSVLFWYTYFWLHKINWVEFLSSLCNIWKAYTFPFYFMVYIDVISSLNSNRIQQWNHPIVSNFLQRDCYCFNVIVWCQIESVVCISLIHFFVSHMYKEFFSFLLDFPAY